MDPDQVTGPIYLCHAAGEGSIDSSVRRPMCVCGGVFCCNILPEEIMEQRPQSYATGTKRSVYMIQSWVMSDCHR